MTNISLSQVKDIILNAFTRAKEVFILKNEYATSENAGVIKVSDYDFTVDSEDDPNTGKSKGKLRLNSSNYYDKGAVNQMVGEKLNTSTYSGFINGQSGTAITTGNIENQIVSASKKLVNSSKANYAAGDSTTPVYFTNGVPTACTAYSKASVNYATSAGSATSASKLSSDAGGSTTPVYFSKGVPVACTAYSSASVNYATSANYANSAGSANSVAWGNVSGKPGSYPPSSHNHTALSSDGNFTLVHGVNDNLLVYKSGGSWGRIQTSELTYDQYGLHERSSRKIKEDIKDVNDEEIKKILDLDIVSYKYKKEFNSDGIERYGLIAEDTYKIIPNIVKLATEDDEKNNIYSSVSYVGLIPYLIRITQLQQEQIDNLQKEIDELKSK